MAIDKMEVESTLTLFMAEGNSLKVLLVRKTTEPYKGYWTLPFSSLKNNETIEDNVLNVTYDMLGIKSVYLEQSHTYTDIERCPDIRCVAINYLGLIDPVTLMLKKEEREIEMKFFDVNDLPKIGYDHENIINKTLNLISSKLTNVNYIKNLFPADFSLPEIEKVLTGIIGTKLDRRNFRKRLLKLDIIEETGEYSEGGYGRPAKLYRFKDNVKDINII